MPKIFISYRRDDSAYPAQSIHETLAAHFGEADVFIDVDHIPLGINFHDYINEAVGKCDILLAVIGDHWLNAQDKSGGRRLDNPNDLVRIEIEAALSRKIPVVPVLVGKASVPQAVNLPETLRELTQRNAAEIRPGRDFHSHLDRLVRGIEHTIDDVKRRAATHGNSRPLSTQPMVAVSTPVEVITNSIGMKLKLIPAGWFMMGSPDSDEEAGDEEKPQHHVEINQPFYLGMYPVTQAEYETVMGNNPSSAVGNARRPVDSVTWFAAVTYCNKLSEAEGMAAYYRIGKKKAVTIAGGGGYRLPTEAEWEYACRAGSITKWCFGDDVSQLTKYAWYDENSGDTTHPVGEKKPNPWGLYDMHGNVWEWCWDDWIEYEYDSRPMNNPITLFTLKHPDFPVYRGGSFVDSSSVVHSAFRDYLESNGGKNHGFRLARTSPPDGIVKG